MRGFGPVDEAAAYRVTSDLVAGQQPSGDAGGGPDGIGGDRDAVGLLDPHEVVRLDVGAERGDDELAGPQRPVADVEVLAIRAVECGLVAQDVLVDDVLDVTGVPETFDGVELVLVGGMLLVFARPLPGRRAASAAAKRDRSVRAEGMGSRVG